MKRTIIFAVVLAAEVFIAQIGQAQGTLYMSNLAQPAAGGGTVASDEWLAAIFDTGTNSGGYDLNSVQLLMNAASGSPSNFVASLYSVNGSISGTSFLGSYLGSISGSTNPSAAGVYTYTASGIAVSPSTQYFLVLTATTPLSGGSYNWSYAGNPSFSSSDNWSFPGINFVSSNGGSNWGRDFSSFQFAIYATAVPEPSIISIFMLGSGVLIYVRRVFRRGGASIDTDC